MTLNVTEEKGTSEVGSNLKDYSRLEYNRHMLVTDYSQVLQPDGSYEEVLLRKNVNEEEDELLYILVGARMKDENILTTDMEYRSLNFSRGKVEVFLINKVLGGTKVLDITTIFNEVATNLGLTPDLELG